MEVVRDTNINIRVNGQLKEDAYAIFEKIGVRPSEAMRMFLTQVTMHKGLPFEVRIPNADTLAAMEEIENGAGTSIDDVDAFFDDILEAAHDETSH